MVGSTGFCSGLLPTKDSGYWTPVGPFPEVDRKLPGSTDLARTTGLLAGSSRRKCRQYYRPFGGITGQVGVNVAVEEAGRQYRA